MSQVHNSGTYVPAFTGEIAPISTFYKVTISDKSGQVVRTYGVATVEEAATAVDVARSLGFVARWNTFQVLPEMSGHVTTTKAAKADKPVAKKAVKKAAPKAKAAPKKAAAKKAAAKKATKTDKSGHQLWVVVTFRNESERAFPVRQNTIEAAQKYAAKVIESGNAARIEVR